MTRTHRIRCRNCSAFVSPDPLTGRCAECHKCAWREDPDDSPRPVYGFAIFLASSMITIGMLLWMFGGN